MRLNLTYEVHHHGRYTWNLNLEFIINVWQKKSKNIFFFELNFLLLFDKKCDKIKNFLPYNPNEKSYHHHQILFEQFFALIKFPPRNC